MHVAGLKTNEKRSNLHQEAETAIKFRLREPGAGIDIEV